MVKLKSLYFHKIDDVPDHILHEMQEFAQKLCMQLLPLIESVEPNIAMTALSWTHAAMLKKLITEKEEELQKAAKMAAYTLIKNMEILIEQMKKEKK